MTDFTFPSKRSVIEISPASQVFLDNRGATLGSWIIAAAFDCVLMGVVLCQFQHFCSSKGSLSGMVHRMQLAGTIFVCLATLLSILKTMQSIGIIWMQDVVMFANPDGARALPSIGWWHVSAPLMTGVTGCLVQSFFAWRFFKLTRNPFVTTFIGATILLAISAISVSTFGIIHPAEGPSITRWFLIHFVSVFIADCTITLGTVYALYRRNTGLSAATTSLVNRLLRTVFETALPPAFVATIDLILTQTLGPKILWHLVPNYMLAKFYVISLLYTMNSIDDYRAEQSSGGQVTLTQGTVRLTARGDMEMGSRFRDLPSAQVQIQKQITKQISPRPPSAIEIRGYTRNQDLSVGPIDEEFDVKQDYVLR